MTKDSDWEGLTFDEFAEIMGVIEESHSWLNMHDNHYKNINKRVYKYVDFRLDTRDMRIWQVTFRQGTPGEEKTFNQVVNMKEEILKWLDGEVK